MLYQFYETQRALLSPFAEFASASAKLYSHPLSPFSHTPLATRVSAGMGLMHRLSKDYVKPEFDIRTVDVDGIGVAVQEQVAVEKPFCRLLRFKRFADDVAMLERIKLQPTVLVVAPLSGHHSTLLRETVRELLRDHKVYLTDWTDARMVPTEVGPFHLDDYVAYVQEFIRHIGPDVNVISVCQPTVPVLAAISLLASAGEPTPRTMTMMGGPIDARKSPTAVNNLATNKSIDWFEHNVIHRVPVNFPGHGRHVYPGFLQHTGFIAMNPDRHLKSHYDFFMDLVRGDDESADFHRSFYDEYNAVLDMPAEYYLDTIKTVFQDFALVNGTWHVNGESVRPQDIASTALLTVEGELDDISGAGQTRAAHDLCTGIPKTRQFHYDVEGAGHYGIFSGRRWREKVYPQVRDFIAAHQGEPTAGVAPGLPSELVLAPPATVPASDDAVALPDASVAAVPAGTSPAPWQPPVDAPRASHPPVSSRRRRWSGRRKSSPNSDLLAMPSTNGSSIAELTDAVEDALPQTQCTRCGFDDCRAYAAAIADGSAGIDQCPPGGAEGVARLAALTGASPRLLSSDHGVEGPLRRAVIDEAACIGCTLCLKACPVDCIVGASKAMHTVIESLCTGCELCLPVCPVDCIALVGDANDARTGWAAWSAAQADEARRRYAFHRFRLARDAHDEVDRLAAMARFRVPSATAGEPAFELPEQAAPR